jgi:hypothetical protein
MVKVFYDEANLRFTIPRSLLPPKLAEMISRPCDSFQQDLAHILLVVYRAFTNLCPELQTFSSTNSDIRLAPFNFFGVLFLPSGSLPESLSKVHSIELKKALFFDAVDTLYERFMNKPSPY